MKVKQLLFSIIVAAFLSSAIGEDHKTLEVGNTAPKIETIKGTNVVDDANSQGKTKVISFWNPKKPASRIANKKLSLQYGKGDNEKVEFISICTDSDENLMKEVMKIDGVNSQNTYSYSEIPSRVFKDYGVEDSPKAYIITPEGKISQII